MSVTSKWKCLSVSLCPSAGRVDSAEQAEHALYLCLLLCSKWLLPQKEEEEKGPSIRGGGGRRGASQGWGNCGVTMLLSTLKRCNVHARSQIISQSAVSWIFLPREWRASRLLYNSLWNLPFKQFHVSKNPLFSKVNKTDENNSLKLFVDPPLSKPALLQLSITSRGRKLCLEFSV